MAGCASSITKTVLLVGAPRTESFPWSWRASSALLCSHSRRTAHSESAGGAGGEGQVVAQVLEFLKPGDVVYDVGANVGL